MDTIKKHDSDFEGRRTVLGKTVQLISRRRFIKKALLLSSGALGGMTGSAGLSGCGHHPDWPTPRINDHFDGTHFSNLEPIRHKGAWAFFRAFFLNYHAEWPDHIPVAEKKEPPERYVEEGIRYTYIGHATLLIQVEGINILTDPIWSERASPFSWIGPKRVRRPGLKIDQLPPIDVILISHNHYDHLDMPTLVRLYETHHPLVLTGLGNASFLKENGILKAQELDWWQHRNFGELKLFFVPAQHFSGRSLSDRDKTLWGGFVVETRYGNIYFAGDTARGRFLKSISEKFGPMFLSFLPIGAFEPRWFMRQYHFDPRDAVRTHLDLQSTKSVGIHFGTFKLSLEGIYSPSRLLKSNLYDFDVDANRFHVPEFGAGYELTV